MDFTLLSALQLMEQETCSECGNFIWLCDTTDKDVYMKVRRRTCSGSRATREAQHKTIQDAKQKREDAKSRNEWGVVYFTQPSLHPQAERTDLPGRKEYYDSKADK